MKRKTKFFILLITGSMLVSLFSCNESSKLKKLQANYIPGADSGVYIGMPMKELRNLRGGENLSVTKRKNVTVLKEECSKDSINLIQYDFNKDNKLDMIIYEYNDSCKLYETMKTKLGEPNSNHAWLIDLNNKFKLLIWTQQHSLCIANNKQFSK